MTRVIHENRGWVGPRDRRPIRPAEESGLTLVATGVPLEAARPGPDTLVLPSGFGAEAGDSSSVDPSETAPGPRAEPESGTPMPLPSPPRP